MNEAVRQQKLVATSENVLPPDHPDRLVYRADLARMLAAPGRRDDARRLRKKILSVAPHGVGAEDPDIVAVLARGWADSAVAFWEDRRLDEARRSFEKALALTRKPGVPPR